MKRSGFSLIELLVVIAVIAILAAILFPVFSLVRERGRKAACVSNLHQIGAAFGTYRADWDDANPPVREIFFSNASATSIWEWEDLLAGRVVTKLGTIWRCPSFLYEKSIFFGPNQLVAKTYTLNPLLANHAEVIEADAPARGRIQASETIAFAEPVPDEASAILVIDPRAEVKIHWDPEGYIFNKGSFIGTRSGGGRLRSLEVRARSRRTGARRPISCFTTATSGRCARSTP